MIQRVQSIYLIFPSFFYFLYWFFGLEWYQKGFGKIIETFENLFDIGPILSIISIIPFLIFLICLIAVFLFKKRRIQLLLSNLALKLSLFMSIFTLFYFFIFYKRQLKLILVSLSLTLLTISPYLTRNYLYFDNLNLKIPHHQNINIIFDFLIL